MRFNKLVKGLCVIFAAVVFVGSISEIVNVNTNVVSAKTTRKKHATKKKRKTRRRKVTKKRSKKKRLTRRRKTTKKRHVVKKRRVVRKAKRKVTKKKVVKRKATKKPVKKATNTLVVVPKKSVKKSATVINSKKTVKRAATTSGYKLSSKQAADYLYNIKKTNAAGNSTLTALGKQIYKQQKFQKSAADEKKVLNFSKLSFEDRKELSQYVVTLLNNFNSQLGNVREQVNARLVANGYSDKQQQATPKFVVNKAMLGVAQDITTAYKKNNVSAHDDNLKNEVAAKYGIKLPYEYGGNWESNVEQSTSDAAWGNIDWDKQYNDNENLETLADVKRDIYYSVLTGLCGNTYYHEWSHANSLVMGYNDCPASGTYYLGVGFSQKTGTRGGKEIDYYIDWINNEYDISNENVFNSKGGNVLY